MIFDETTGEVTDTQEVSEEAAVSQEQPETSSLEQFLNEAAESEADAQSSDSNEQAEQTDAVDQAFDNNKGIKGRIQAERAKADKSGYERGRAEAQAEFDRIKSEYEERLAKYAEMELESEAQQLSRDEHISVEFAKRILRAEKGVKAPTTQQPQAQSQQPTLDVKQRAQELYTQAQAVKQQYGIDPLEVFQRDQSVKAKVANGEWDMKDVALYAMKNNPTTEYKKPTPAPVRSGATRAQTSGGLDFANMSDEDFDKFNEKIRRGEKYTPR